MNCLKRKTTLGEGFSVGILLFFFFFFFFVAFDFFSFLRFYRKVAKMIQGVSIYLSSNPGIVLFCPILPFSLTCAVFYFTLGLAD